MPDYKIKESHLRFMDLTAQTFSVFFVIQIIAVFMSIITARLLGPSGRGIVAVVILCPTLLFNLGHLSIHRVLTTQVNQGRHSFNVYCGTVLFFISVMTLFCCGVFSWIYMHHRHIFFHDVNISFSLVLMGLGLLPFLFIVHLFSSLLQTREKIEQMNLVLLAQTMIAFLAIFIFVLLAKMGIAGAVAAYLLANICSALLCLYYVFKICPWPWAVSFPLLKGIMADGMRLHIGVISVFLYQKIDQLMLAHYKETSDVGFYAVAVSFTELLLLIPLATQNIFYAKLSQVKEADVRHEMIDSAMRVYKHSLFLLICSGIFLAFSFTTLIKIFYGTAFLPSFMPFLILLPGAFFLYVNNILSNYIIGTRHFLAMSFMASIAAILNIILNIFLIPAYGANGASVASTITYVLLGCALIVCFVRVSGLGFLDFLRRLVFRKADFELYGDYSKQVFQKILAFRRG